MSEIEKVLKLTEDEERQLKQCMTHFGFDLYKYRVARYDTVLKIEMWGMKEE